MEFVGTKIRKPGCRVNGLRVLVLNILKLRSAGLMSEFVRASDIMAVNNGFGGVGAEKPWRQYPYCQELHLYRLCPTSSPHDLFESIAFRYLHKSPGSLITIWTHDFACGPSLRLKVTKLWCSNQNLPTIELYLQKPCTPSPIGSKIWASFTGPA